MPKVQESVKNKGNTCRLCGAKNIGFGNNPWPIESNGRCCNMCNSNYVIKARLLLMDPRTERIKNRQALAKAFYRFLKDREVQE